MSESNPLVIARAKPASKVAQIKAMCAHCMGCDLERIEPGYRLLVRECTAMKCPLWQHRPYRTKDQREREALL